jgi:hypothetical protein
MHAGMTTFPPAPRSWREFVDEVVDDLLAVPSTAALPWEPVHLFGLGAPWVGVRVPTIASSARAWVWDVVTPEDHQRNRALHGDPLALAVAQDTVIVDLQRDDDAGFSLRLQVPVRSVPSRIDLPASCLPIAPWRVEVSSGWTSGAIGSAIVAWFEDRLGLRRNVCAAGRVTPVTSAGDHFQVGDGLYAAGSSFDVLLGMPSTDAARVTTFFGAVADALSPVR